MTNRKRREWWLSWIFYKHDSKHREVFDQRISDDDVYVREVMPDDPDPEWVDELIRLCEEHGISWIEYGIAIQDHLAKRGTE